MSIVPLREPSTMVVYDIEGVAGISTRQRDEIESWMHGITYDEYVKNRVRVTISEKMVSIITSARTAQEQALKEAREIAFKEGREQALKQVFKGDKDTVGEAYDQAFHDIPQNEEAEHIKKKARVVKSLTNKKAIPKSPAVKNPLVLHDDDYDTEPDEPFPIKKSQALALC